jgi:hypothetical protein
VLRRSLGRRIDPDTGAAYHLDTNRPPYDLICKERLIAPTDAANPSEALALQLASHDLSVGPLLQFLRPFGTLKVVDSATVSAQGAFAQCAALISGFLEAKAAAAAEAQAAEADAAGSRLSDDAAADEPSSRELAPRVARSPKAVPALPPPLAALLTSLWDAMEAQYASGAKAVFRALREERLLATGRLQQQRAAFADFLRRPDGARPDVCAAFLAAFNAIPPEVRPCAAVELETRCQELRWALWECEEAREVAATARLQTLMADGWLPLRVRAVERSFAMLLQLEVMRFTAALQVLMDFASGMQGSGVLPEGLLPPIAATADVSPEAAGAAKGGKDKGGKAKGEGVSAPPVRPLAPADCTAAAFASAKDPKAAATAAAAAAPAAAKKGSKELAKEEVVAAPVDASALGLCLAAALAAVTPWQPARFPIAEAAEATAAGVLGAAAADITPPPPPPSLHRAVWAEAERCEWRLRRCATKGAAAVAELEATVAHAHAEMGAWVCSRTEEELVAGEALVAVAQAAVAAGSPLPGDWRLDGIRLTLGSTRVLVATPLLPPTPKLLPQHRWRLNALQTAVLAKSLAAASAAEGLETAATTQKPQQDRVPITGGGAAAAAGGLLSTGALAAVLLRLAASDGELPVEWSLGPSSEGFAGLVAALDPSDCGFVAVDSVLGFFDEA